MDGWNCWNTGPCIPFCGWANSEKTDQETQPGTEVVTYTQGDLQLDVFYCSPSKKGRKIFGELVPYGEVWRTGANEATTFTTNKDLIIDGKKLVTGNLYSIWTIPEEDSWTIIFNNKMYNWGVKSPIKRQQGNPILTH